MMRLRMFMGLTTALYGVAGLQFEYDVGISWLVQEEPEGWQFGAAMIFSGLLMLWAADARMERRAPPALQGDLGFRADGHVDLGLLPFAGRRRRQHHADRAGLHLVLHWSWLGEATLHRNRTCVKEVGE
jgi:hypothetical protein